LLTGVSYNEETARRDKLQREKLLERLNKKIKRGVKSLISKPAYTKYLNIRSGEVEINEKKIEEEKRWDGIYGFSTNNKELSSIEIIDSYKMLWQIEEAFKCMKSTLDIAPVYHYVDRRIEAHILLCFLSFYIHRAIQKRLSEFNIKITVPKVLESLSEIQALRVKFINEEHTLRTEINPTNRKILKAFGVKIPSVIISPIKK